MRTDLYRQVAVKTSLAADTYADDDTFNGDAVDLMGEGQRFRSAMAVVVYGDITATYDGTVKLQESMNGTNWTDVDDDSLDGEFLAAETANAEKVKVVGYRGVARYLRLVLAAAAAADQTAFVTGLILVAPGSRAVFSQP